MRETETGINYEEEAIQERCGLIALYSTVLDTPRKVDLAMRAGIGVQHRGQLGVGIAYPTPGRIRHHVGNGLLHEVFTPQLVSGFTDENPNHWLQLQFRYGTDENASNTDQNLQPVVAPTPDGGQLSLIHNGQFTDKDGIRKLLYEYSGKEFSDDVSDSFLVAQLIANAPGDTWEERVTIAINKINGAFSLCIGVEDKLFLARDEFGLRPLKVGRVSDGWMAASETRALRKVGIETERDILRGEIARIDENGLTTIQEGLEGAGNFCDFEVAYFGGPDSLFPTFNSPDDARHPERWMTNYEARKLAGIYTARKMGEKIKRLDLITAAPDSGIPFGAGLAIGSGLPFEPLIIRDHYDPKAKTRLFQNPNIALIARQVGGKLSVVPGSVRGKRIGAGDDSNVRSNVGKELNKLFRDEGAIEVHGIYGFPAPMFPCHLGISMHTTRELVAGRHNGDLEAIAAEMGMDSVTYVTFSDFIRARKNGGEVLTPKDIQNIFLENGGCGGCLTGRYPIDANGVIFDYKEKVA